MSDPVGDPLRGSLADRDLGLPAAFKTPVPLLPGPIGIAGIVASGFRQGPGADQARSGDQTGEDTRLKGTLGGGLGGVFGGGTVSVLSPFLSLYLVLMAFFIALVSLADLRPERSQAVLNAVQTRFSGDAVGPLPFPSDGGMVLNPARSFVQHVGDLFETELPGSAVQDVLPGPILEATLPLDAMFRPGEDQPRPGLDPLFTAIAAALANPPRGVLHEMVITAYTGGAPGDPYPPVDALELRRAAALAEVLHHAGAPNGSVVAAVGPGPLGQVVFTGRALAEGGVLR
ncbi:MAG: hypothetical protein ACPGOY_13090 [Rhodospirillaceae bacterium]